MRKRLRLMSSGWGLLAVAAVLALGIFLASPGGRGCKSASAAELMDYGQFPSDFCYQVAISTTNTSGSPVTDAMVRVPINSLGFRTTRQMDSQLWDLYTYLSVFSQEVDLLAQDASSTTARWWLHYPSIPAGATSIETLTFGEDSSQRDQGIFFTDNETVSAAHAAAFNMTDNVELRARVEVRDSAAQTATLAGHWSADQGIRLRLVDSGGLAIQAQANAATCTVAWEAPWTDANIWVRVTFANPTLTVYVNDVVENACNTGLGSISTVTTSFLLGDSLNQALLRDVRFGAVASGTVAHWGFDPTDMAETIAVNPFQGTIADQSGNLNTASYTFNRSQANYSVSVGAVELVDAGPLYPPATVVPDLLFGPDVFGGLAASPTPAPTSIFCLIYCPMAAAWVGPDNVFWAVLFFDFGLIALMIAWKTSRGYMPMVFLLTAIPALYAAKVGYLPWWYFVFWAAFTLVSWFAFRHGEGGT